MKMRYALAAMVSAIVFLICPLYATTVTAFSPASTQGSVLIPGDLLVYRETAVGPILANTGANVLVDEINPTIGNLVATYATGMFDSGTANQEGLLTVNSGGAYLAIPGYVSTDTSSLNGGSVNREIAVVNLSTNQADTTLINGSATGISTGSFYTAYTDDDTNLYAATQRGGIWLASDQQSSATPTTGGTVVATPTSAIGLTSFGGSFYYTSGAPSADKVFATPADPTTSATSTAIAQSGISGTKFVGLTAANLSGGTTADTLWLADQGNNEIQRFDLIGSTWDAAGALSLSSFSSTDISVEDITGENLGNGDEELFVTLGAQAGTSGATILKFEDTSGDDGTLSTVTATTPSVLDSLSGTVCRGARQNQPKWGAQNRPVL